MGLKAFKYWLYLTTKQTQTLQWTLEHCRELYNAALQERRDAYRMAGKSITYYDQVNQLPEIEQIREEYQDVHSQVLQDVLRKADKAFQAFFKYTSQVCSGCGTVKKKELSERWHSCECGCELDRDHNATINVLRLGRSRQASA